MRNLYEHLNVIKADVGDGLTDYSTDVSIVDLLDVLNDGLNYSSGVNLTRLKGGALWMYKRFFWYAGNTHYWGRLYKKKKNNWEIFKLQREYHFNPRPWEIS